MRVSFDVGGTFTDVVLADDARGRFFRAKTLTTYDDMSRAIASGIRGALVDAGSNVDAIDKAVIGATTLITNALIERRGDRVALLTTRGFADVLEIGREWRYDLYDLRLEFPTPLVPTELRLEVTERIRADGTVESPLDETTVQAAHDLLEGAGATSVAVCLLNAYQNAEHERRAAKLLQERDPELPVTISSDLVPEIREFERTSTTVANAYVRSIAQKHLAHIADALNATGITEEMYVMQSNGGITDVSTAAKYPIRLLESGPAAGALGAAFWARQMGIEKLIAFDMGGTTAKVCLIERGEPNVTRSFEAARVHRFKRGSGMPLNLPVVDLLEIGAGGGSIARIDRLGLLKVGPDSAGADPGPACYGRGGEEPTVTDADLILGYLDPESFLGGRMALDTDAAESALVRKLGGTFDGSALKASIGIISVVEESMALATRIHATEKGCDPRDYTMFAFGGAAPIHAAAIARTLGIRQVVIPALAGVLAASGLHVAKPSVTLGRTRLMNVSQWNDAAVDEIYDLLRTHARADLAAFLEAGDIVFSYSADMRFRGQGFELEVELPPEFTRADVEAAFTRTYADVYGPPPPDAEAQVISWRLRATIDWPDRPDIFLAGTAGDQESFVDETVAWFPGCGQIAVPRFSHRTLAAGSSLAGPAIIQQDESTIVLGPGDQADVLEHGHVQVTVDQGEDRSNHV